MQRRRHLDRLTGSIIGAIGLLFGTVWFYFRDRGDYPLSIEDMTGMDKNG
jgi:hypothetical protein